MLRKCMKYDLKASIRIWSLLSFAMLIMSVLGGLSLRGFIDVSESPMIILSALGVFVYYILSVSYLVCGFGLGVYRFYRSFRTDEAYLTFTLPVKRKTLLNSKILSTLVIFLATAIVILISVIITLAFIPDGEHGILFSFVQELPRKLASGYSKYGFFSIVYILQCIMLILEGILTVILFCFAIAGNVSFNGGDRKRNTAKDIGIGIGIYFGLGFLSLPIIFTTLAILAYSDATEIAGTLSTAEIPAVIFFALIVLMTAVSIVNVILYKISLNKLEKKINLT